MVASTEQIEILEPEIVTDDKVFVAGRNWSSMDIRRSVTIEGHTIKEILLDQLRREFAKSPTEFQETLWLSRCRCKVNGEEIEASKWDSYVPKAGEFVEFLVAPGKGGGGGKNILNTVLMVAVVAVAIMTQQYYLTTYGTLTTGTGLTGAAAAEAASIGIATTYTAGSYAAAGLAAAAVMTVGTYAVNKICPVTVSPQQSASSQGAQSSNVYSINGSSNSANPYGYVPLVLGRFRYAGPLGAKSWTKQIGDDQYFNMLVIWGHSDMTAKDFRIGETPLSEFSDVEHIFHGATTGNDLKYFSKSYNEQSVGAALAYNEPIVRYVGECDSISVDIYFPALADASSGKTEGADVTFNIEYALEGTEDWKFYSASTRFFAPAQYIDSYTGVGPNDAWCTADGTWHVWPDDGAYGKGRPNPYISPADSHWETYPLERYKDKHKHHEYWFRDAWYDAGETKDIVIGAASTSPVTRSFEWAVPHGEYKVRITRVSKDLEKDTVYDDATWSIARAITSRPAFNTPIPVCCSELRIRASEQLSGYVSDFNALCTSRFPIYGTYDADGDKIKSAYGWVKESDPNGVIIENDVIIEDDDIDYVVGETVNPADHIRYLLTSRHALINPYTESKIDEASLAKFAQYCLDTDYQFSLVCDSEAAAWNRLTAVASAGRGAITADNDGLFGVMIDNADKTVTQMFTPRNSWGFSIERAFYTLPHALRISFYDENDDYKQKEGFVYADGYNKNNATDIVEWSMTGKTRWEDNYRMGRYYLASIKLRPITVTLSTDWEWMMCRRGDVVGVSHDVLLNTFGTARVIALIYRDDKGASYYVTHEDDMPSTDAALPIGVRLDDTVIFSENATYGIAIRSRSGTVLTYQVNRILNAETADLIFTYGITAAQCPYIGALASVSTLGNETSKYLVAAISVSDNNSAELTLVPWAMPDILDSESGNIPAWEPPIYLPTIGSKGSLPAPSIRDIKSDESMLKRSGNSLIVCMGVWWNLPSGIDSSHGRIFVQGRIAPASKPEATLATNMVDSTALNYVEFPDVIEGETYVVQLRLIGDNSGVVSNWSEVMYHSVIGRTAKPKAPTGVKFKLNPPVGLNVSWDKSEELDVTGYHVVLSGNNLSWEGRTQDLYVDAPLRNWYGELTAKVYAVDVLGLESETPTQATFIVERPASPEVTTSFHSDIFVMTWADCQTSWPIDYYEIYDVYTNKTYKVADEWTSISMRPILQSYKFNITSIDIFGNRSEAKSASVYIPGIDTPEPTIRIDGTQFVVSWNTVNSPFSVEYYEIFDVTNKLIGKVKGTNFSFFVPEADSSSARFYTYRVQAIDAGGNTSAKGEATIEVYPPRTPVISANLEGDHIQLTWTAPSSDVPVVGYDIVRQWDVQREDGVVETHEEDYGRQDTLYLSIPAVSAGSHTFLVRAVDNSGCTSSWASADFVARNPGSVTFFNCNTIDNNVMIYYTDPNYIFFPIREYVVYEIKDGDLAVEVGRTDTHFFADIKNESGAYTYIVTPIDIAGNYGESKRITLSVAQPPDYIMYIDKFSLFNGERTNMELDGKGHMYGPVPKDETWNANISRAASALGISEDKLTWQNKIDGGMNAYFSPAISEQGKYVEIIDVGTFVPATKINVTVTSEVLDGNPEMTCRIEVSEDGQIWKLAVENGLVAYENSFRYVKYTFTWTGGLVLISEINYKLDVKRKTDFGKIEVDANDNGESWISETATPMLTGKWVDFNVQFTDVQSIPKPNIVNDMSGGLTAFVVFEDVLNPKGFRIFVKDKNGQRASAIVDWSAFGV